MKTYTSLTVFLLCLCGAQLFAIQNFNIRFLLDDIDCDNKQACYLVQLSSADGQEWNLAGQNYRIFYNSANAVYIDGSVESRLSSEMYANPQPTTALSHVNASGTGPLPFEGDLGFLNYSIDLMTLSSGGIDLPANGDWVTTSSLCFTIEDALIEDPSECLHIIWGRMGVSDDYASGFVEVAQWVSPNMTSKAIGTVYDDLDADDGDAACLTKFCDPNAGSNENTVASCSDNVDNDNDGLVDCADPSCATIAQCMPDLKSYDINLALKTVDCQTGMACYNITLSSATGENFRLGNQHYRLYYDTEIGTFASVVSRLDVNYQPVSVMGATPIENQDATGRGDLPFEDNLGYVDFSIDLVSNDAGTDLIVSQTSPALTAEICFNMTSDAIMDENICFETAWARTALTSGYNPNELEISEWVSAGVQQMMEVDDFNDLSAASGNTACFNTSCSVDERGEALCNDGVDNDSDGLTDCFDSGCSTASVCADNCTAQAPTLSKRN